MKSAFFFSPVSRPWRATEDVRAGGRTGVPCPEEGSAMGRGRGGRGWHLFFFRSFWRPTPCRISHRRIPTPPPHASRNGKTSSYYQNAQPPRVLQQVGLRLRRTLRLLLHRGGEERHHPVQEPRLGGDHRRRSRRERLLHIEPVRRWTVRRHRVRHR